MYILISGSPIVFDTHLLTSTTSFFFTSAPAAATFISIVHSLFTAFQLQLQLQLQTPSHL